MNSINFPQTSSIESSSMCRPRQQERLESPSIVRTGRRYGRTILTSVQLHVGLTCSRMSFIPGCTCYRSNVESWTCSPNTRQSEAGTRPRPSARTKWLGEPADMRCPSQAGDSGLCEACEARSSRRPAGLPTKEHSYFWFSKDSWNLLPDENQEAQGDWC